MKVTFPEGFTVAQMGARLTEKITFMSPSDFASAATDGSVVSSLAPQGTTNLEGLLFPDTYQVSGDDTEARVVGRLSSMMERVARQENLEASAKSLGYTPYQILIIASLIEREAKVPEDRAKIAQVIYNRLAKKMKLEIDATLLYNADPNAAFADLKAMDTPYNTYMHEGLPPTPIANPGRAAIKAALAPAGKPSSDDEACVGLPKTAKCEYLYYVLADKDGRHVFATTYEQHLANIEKSRAAGVLP
ncbi:MAG: endolytic transglycosylase MltG [Actinobacteria bacterium]|nr:endolytic transglycosylase MltG [Actinomycetota bacterium]